MDPTLGKEIARLRQSKVKELQSRYRELFGEDSPSANREHLYRRIAWRLQARETGELSNALSNAPLNWPTTLNFGGVPRQVSGVPSKGGRLPALAATRDSRNQAPDSRAPIRNEPSK
jgi:hypothetical protein